MAQIALELEVAEDLRQATETLIRKHPNRMPTHYYNALRATMDGQWVTAEKEIKKAESLGLPPEAAEKFLDAGVRRRARVGRWTHYALYLLAAWAGGLLVLFLGGKALSIRTLGSIERSDPNASTRDAEVRLRKCYRAFIRLVSSYYYISIPFVISLVIGAAGSVIYGFLMLGRVPIKLVVILGLGAVFTVFKMVQSLFIRIDSEEPGRTLRAEEAPGLWDLTREVAQRLSTRPIDEIRLTPGTEMAVYERGRSADRRRDEAQRVLIMGVGLLNGFSQGSFRAVLAHEYGHFSHRDTAGGEVALRVRQDMMKFAIALVQAGQAVWWNIGFQFLRIYDFLFRRISHGATRLQEVLADRAAAQIYGPQAFEEGLRHVIRRQIEFDHFANKEIAEAIQTERALQNLYSLPTGQETTVEEAISEAMARRTSEDDTHPGPVDRFRLVGRVVCPDLPPVSGTMWDLFGDREALTQEMSSAVEKDVKAAIA